MRIWPLHFNALVCSIGIIRAALILLHISYFIVDWTFFNFATLQCRNRTMGKKGMQRSLTRGRWMTTSVVWYVLLERPRRLTFWFFEIFDSIYFLTTHSYFDRKQLLAENSFSCGLIDCCSLSVECYRRASTAECLPYVILTFCCQFNFLAARVLFVCWFVSL